MAEAFEVQTRNEAGRLQFFRTLTEAVDEAKKDKTIWKISFGLPTGERCRLVRDTESSDFILESLLPAELLDLYKEAKANG